MTRRRTITCISFAGATVAAPPPPPRCSAAPSTPVGLHRVPTVLRSPLRSPVSPSHRLLLDATGGAPSHHCSVPCRREHRRHHGGHQRRHFGRPHPARRLSTIHLRYQCGQEGQPQRAATPTTSSSPSPASSSAHIPVLSSSSLPPHAAASIHTGASATAATCGDSNLATPARSILITTPTQIVREKRRGLLAATKEMGEKNLFVASGVAALIACIRDEEIGAVAMKETGLCFMFWGRRKGILLALLLKEER